MGLISRVSSRTYRLPRSATIMSSKINKESLYEAIDVVLADSKGEGQVYIKDDKEFQMKKRNFVETVELQVMLKNYDPQKDKRFSGTVKLPIVARPKFNVCVLGNQAHIDQDKKLVKKLAKRYDAFIASDALIRQIPRLLGPGLNKAGKFPAILGASDDMQAKIDEMQATIKFQMKKVLCLAVAVGTVEMSADELAQNINMSINFLVSLLKKQWQNVRSLHIKSSMGRVQRLY